MYGQTIFFYLFFFCLDILFLHYYLISRSEYQKVNLKKKKKDKVVPLVGISARVYMEIPWTEGVVGWDTR